MEYPSNKWCLYTISVEGKLTNLAFDEKKLMNGIKIEEHDRIYCVATSTCQYYHPNPKYAAEVIYLRDKKKKNERKSTTRGNEFNSCISLYIKPDPNSSKFYIPKIFRTGSLQCQGVLCPDFSDFLPAVEILCEFFERNLKRITEQFPITPTINEINYYLQSRGETPVQFMRYLGPIRLYSMAPILQNWLYHLSIGSQESINLMELDRILDNSKARLDHHRLEIVEKTYEPGAKNLRLKVRGGEANDPITMFVTRKGKINMNGRANNSLVTRLKNFIDEINIGSLIMQRAIPDSERDDLEDDDDIEFTYALSAVNLGPPEE